MDVVEITDRTPVSIWRKLNPLWRLVGPDGWSVPDINNGDGQGELGGLTTKATCGD